MNDRRSPRDQRLGSSFLDALHESRRRQALREIDNYRHLLLKSTADETQRAIEELKRESIPISSLWQWQFSWILVMMKQTRSWMLAGRLLVRQIAP